MKNKKGEFNISLMILVAVGVIVGLIMLQAAASYVGQSTSTSSWANKTITLSSGTYTDIQGAQTAIGTYILYNQSSNTSTIGATNLTVVERVGDDGQKTVAIKVLDARWNGRNVNITGEFGPDGYIEDSGGRAITGLIVLFGALAIGIFTMVPSVRNIIMDNLGF